jgi:hypothetical protein
VDDAADALGLDVDGEIGLLGNFVWVIDTGEALDLTAAGLRVDTALVGLLAVFEGSVDVDEEDGSRAGDGLAGLSSAVLVGSDRSGDDGGTGTSELGGNETRPGCLMMRLHPSAAYAYPLRRPKTSSR